MSGRTARILAVAAAGGSRTYRRAFSGRQWLEPHLTRGLESLAGVPSLSRFDALPSEIRCAGRSGPHQKLSNRSEVFPVDAISMNDAARRLRPPGLQYHLTRNASWPRRNCLRFQSKGGADG